MRVPASLRHAFTTCGGKLVIYADSLARNDQCEFLHMVTQTVWLANFLSFEFEDAVRD